jgi:endonuclease-3
MPRRTPADRSRFRRTAARSAERRAPSIATIIRRLQTAYGPRPWKTWGPPLEELIVTVLSQNTTGRNCDLAMERLRRALPDWDRAAEAPLSVMAAAIRPAGLHRQKARSLRAILRRLRAERGRVTLDFIRHWPTERIRRYLLDLPGVGPKTAACVLCFSLRRPVLPVDTHVGRVSKRLGLIPPPTTAEQAHEVLGAMVPPRQVYTFHVLLIEHGRKVCRARRPACNVCALAGVCPSAFSFERKAMR